MTQPGGTGKLDTIAIEGSLTVFGVCDHPENAVLSVDHRGTLSYLEGRDAMSSAPPWLRGLVNAYGHLIVLEEPNGFVTAGLNLALDRLTGANGPPSAIQCMIVAKSTTAVAATDTSILGGSTAPTFTTASQNAFSATLAAPAFATASAASTTGGISFTQASITGGSNFWPMNRVGLVNVAAATNGGLVDVIGNTAAQADPYSRTFSIDFSSVGSFTLNPQITLTAIKQQSAFPTPL